MYLAHKPKKILHHVPSGRVAPKREILAAILTIMAVGAVIALAFAFMRVMLNTATTSAEFTTTSPAVTHTTEEYTTTYTTTTYQTSSTVTPTQNGNLNFAFTLLNGTQGSWAFPISTYDYYVQKARISPILHFNISGKWYEYPDYRAVVTPSLFAGVVPTLTKGRTAGQFVDEVINIKNQITTYSTVFLNESTYPAEILGSRSGDCKDFGVLMASILEAGNIQAGYGMRLQFVYVNAEHLSSQNQIPNHLILYIEYANGTTAFVDTTNILEYQNFVRGTIYGWYENLTCTMSGCQTQTLCSGAYCDGVFYYTSETHYNYCANASYVTGPDDTCHPSCGVWGYYCSTGYSCSSDGYCVS